MLVALFFNSAKRISSDFFKQFGIHTSFFLQYSEKQAQEQESSTVFRKQCAHGYQLRKYPALDLQAFCAGMQTYSLQGVSEDDCTHPQDDSQPKQTVRPCFLRLASLNILHSPGSCLCPTVCGQESGRLSEKAPRHDSIYHSLHINLFQEQHRF